MTPYPQVRRRARPDGEDADVWQTDGQTPGSAFRLQKTSCDWHKTGICTPHGTKHRPAHTETCRSPNLAIRDTQNGAKGHPARPSACTSHNRAIRDTWNGTKGHPARQLTCRSPNPATRAVPYGTKHRPARIVACRSPNPAMAVRPLFPSVAPNRPDSAHALPGTHRECLTTPIQRAVSRNAWPAAFVYRLTRGTAARPRPLPRCGCRRRASGGCGSRAS